jgi:Bacteriophage CI repressor helix-turn-helix domain.
LTQQVRRAHTSGVETQSLIQEVFQKAGGRRRLMASLGLSKQSMSDWVRRGEVPIKHCPKVHALTRIPLARLNHAFNTSRSQRAGA